MAQNTGLMTWIDAVVSYSTNGTTYTDISGSVAAVGVKAGQRQIGKMFTGSADTPVAKVGKRDALEVAVKIGYSEGATDAYTQVLTDYLARNAVYLRWAPKGSGNKDYNTTSGLISGLNPVYPQGDYSKADILDMEFSVVASDASVGTAP